jgi:hypothetical protein
VYVCEGLFTPDVLPSPKFHDHAVGVFVEMSVNWTVSGVVPEVGEPVKFATGAGGLTLI